LTKSKTFREKPVSLLATFKGWLGETHGAVANAVFLDDRVYTTINDVTIPTRNGTTQIDHVIVSRYGVLPELPPHHGVGGIFDGRSRQAAFRGHVLGRCGVQDPHAPNVLTRGYASFIKSKQEVLFSDAEVTQLAESLRAGMLPQTRATRTAHIQSLKERQGSTTTCREMRTALGATDCEVRAECWAAFSGVFGLSEMQTHQGYWR
jgi:restriction system protein